MTGGGAPDILAILMAKDPAQAGVKTRLAVKGSPLTDTEVAAVATAMLKCTASRLARHFEVVLAVSPDDAGAALVRTLSPGCTVRTAGQGSGDLGERMARLWMGMGAGRPVAFFGMDSPDVPVEHLAAIPLALAASDAAIGPTGDGGFWTLACRAHHPAILAGIDWGTSSVYDQTCRRLIAAGLRYQPLPAWDDVDRPEDMTRLAARIRDADDPDLATLSGILDAILG